jgi:hypothetical protein
MSKFIYVVTERYGNFSHTLEEFDNPDEAAEFMLDRATEDAQEVFTVHKSEVPDFEWEEALENALDYYAIEKWEV